MIIKKLSYQHILKDLSFELRPKTTYGVLGENGSGKSTLLKALAGYHRNYTGEILLEQGSMKNLSIQQLYQTRAVLTQHNTIQTSILCKDYLELSAYNNSHSSENFVTVLTQVTHRLNLGPILDKDYLACSGGEQQRLNIARVFLQAQLNLSAQRQQYIFLDEPFNSLDIKYIPLVRKYLSELQGQGFCIVIVLHDLNLAYQLCDQILFLKAGNLVGFGDRDLVFTLKNLNLAFDIPFEEIHTTSGEKYFKS